MDFNRKLENLLRDIREIENDAVDVSNTREISKIEMDLLMEKVRRLYDHLLYIDRHYPYGQGNERQDIPFEVTHRKSTGQSRQQPSPEPEEKETHDSPKEKQPEANSQETSQTRPKVTQDQASPSMKKPQPSHEGSHEKKSAESSEAGDTGKRREEHAERSQPASQAKEKPGNARQEETTWKGSAEKKTDGPEIVADKYQNSRTFRHDDLAAKQPQNNLSTRMQSRPIQDLSKAIGLNDKFLFIRELFEGDKEKYHEAIQIINEIPSFEEAQSYIQERFNWDEEQPEVQKFMDLVRRKFYFAQ